MSRRSCALSALATTYWKTGRWDESERMESECLLEAERSRDLWGITASSTNIAIIWCGRGEFNKARPHFERALEIHRRLGSPSGQALAHLNLGECDEILGRFDEAETNYRLMLDLLGDDRGNKNVLEARLALGNLIRKRQYDNVSGAATLQFTTDYVDGFTYLTAGTGSAASSRGVRAAAPRHGTPARSGGAGRARGRGTCAP